LLGKKVSRLKLINYTTLISRATPAATIVISSI